MLDVLVRTETISSGMTVSDSGFRKFVPIGWRVGQMDGALDGGSDRW